MRDRLLVAGGASLPRRCRTGSLAAAGGAVRGLRQGAGICGSGRPKEPVPAAGTCRHLLLGAMRLDPGSGCRRAIGPGGWGAPLRRPVAVARPRLGSAPIAGSGRQSGLSRHRCGGLRAPVCIRFPLLLALAAS